MDLGVRAAISVLCDKVISGVITEKDIIKALASEINKKTVGDTEILINDSYGTYRYSNEFKHWYVGYKGLDYNDKDVIKFLKNKWSKTLISRQEGAQVMGEFGKYMVNKLGLTSIIERGHPYFDVLTNYPLRLEFTKETTEETTKEIDLLYDLLMDKGVNINEINENSWLHPSNKNSQEIIRSGQSLISLIGPENFKPCLISYREEWQRWNEEKEEALFSNEEKRYNIMQDPYSFAIYVLSKYKEDTASLLGSVIPDDVYIDYGLYLASGKGCDFIIVTVNNFRHWRVREYDGKEYISYPEY